jgi:hypothetical protein
MRSARARARLQPSRGHAAAAAPASIAVYEAEEYYRTTVQPQLEDGSSITADVYVWKEEYRCVPALPAPSPVWGGRPPCDSTRPAAAMPPASPCHRGTCARWVLDASMPTAC